MSAAFIGRKTPPLAAVSLLVLLCVSIAGCVTDSAASLRDARAEAPRPSSKPAYLPLDDMPSNRKAPALTTDEQSKLKQDLAAARDRQATAARARNDK
jgi:hypothetical protein